MVPDHVDALGEKHPGPPGRVIGVPLAQGTGYGREQMTPHSDRLDIGTRSIPPRSLRLFEQPTLQPVLVVTVGNDFYREAKHLSCNSSSAIS